MGSICVNNLGKAYRQYPTRWSRLVEWLDPLSRDQHHLKWILKDVNFQIGQGETVGIIGINGAGKSTLLKLITGTIQPTIGSVEMAGRVVALLELGMGFHPDFTGRQNVVMSGQLIGLGADKIASLMPQIESFAEIGEYIDQPIRTYSSGMLVRLAFSVATSVRPDILIVDEALAVGDIYFQQKCFDRINKFINSGTTFLFVSHSMDTVLNICTRAIFIRQGIIAHDGTSQDAIDLYQSDLLESLDREPNNFKITKHQVGEVSDNTQLKNENLIYSECAPVGKTGSIHTECVVCTGVRFIDNNGRRSSALVSDTRVTLEVDYLIRDFIQDPHVGFKIKNRFGIVLFETNTYCMGCTIGPMNAQSKITVRFVFELSLIADEYSITLGFGNSGFGDGSFEQVFGFLHEATVFTVLPNLKSIKWAGLINLRPEVEFIKQ